VSIHSFGGPSGLARNGRPDPNAAPDAAGATADCLEFVRFCYRRRRVSWPALYDEMCAVAARGEFRSLGYPELAERGINLCLIDLPQLAALTELVRGEERTARDVARDAAHDGAMDDPRPVTIGDF
jgi:hypothetical protein